MTIRPRWEVHVEGDDPSSSGVGIGVAGGGCCILGWVFGVGGVVRRGLVMKVRLNRQVWSDGDARQHTSEVYEGATEVTEDVSGSRV